MSRRILFLSLCLGWVPTLAFVFGLRWGMGVPLFAAGPAPLKVTKIYTGSDGKTKMVEFEMPLEPQGLGVAASKVLGATSAVFRRSDREYFTDWHPASNRQLVVTLSGESEIELEGGKKIRLGPGHILLAEDTTGQGHISRASGTQGRVSLTVPLAPGVRVPGEVDR